MGPEPISFIQAVDDISKNRFAQFFIRRWRLYLFGCISTFVMLGIFALEYTHAIFPGIPFGFLVVVAFYIFAQARFVYLIQKNQPFCPSCKKTVWQVRCAHCSSPVPILALLMKGAFLAHCPHCGKAVNAKDKTLEGFCGFCLAHFPRPDIHYFKDTAVYIEISSDLNKNKPDGFKMYDHGKFLEFHTDLDTSISLTTGNFAVCYRVTDTFQSFRKIPSIMYSHVRKVKIGADVNPIAAKELLDAIPLTKRKTAKLDFENESSMFQYSENLKETDFKIFRLVK